METWPASLPNPTADYGGKHEASALRTRMSSGTFRQRRLYSTPYVELNVNWSFDDAQYDYFRSWVFYRLNDGNDWFSMPVFLGGGLRTVVVRFVGGNYEFNNKGVLTWQVSAKMELESVPFTSITGSSEQLQTFSGNNLLTFAGDNIKTF